MGKYTNSPLQWAGSKQNMLDNLLPILERRKQDLFVEPFVGAMNVSLNFQGCNSYYLADSNIDIINTFSAIDISYIDYLNNLTKLAELPVQENYMDIRKAFNQTGKDNIFTSASYFGWLNKAGFNGLCRYNSKGEYNVPKGNKEYISVPTEQILAAHKFLSEHNVILKHQDFREVFKYINTSDKPTLVYCDPPYVALKSDFKYTVDGFNLDCQKELKTLALQSPHTVILSNHWTDFTEQLYSDADEIYLFDVKRTISCKGSERKRVQECVVVYKGDSSI